MTAADKLRERLATRPGLPGMDSLVRWWRTSGDLVPKVLEQLVDLQVAVDAYKTASEPAFDEIAKLCGCPQWDYPGQLIRDVQNVVQERDNLRKDLDDARAKLRREQDARSELRLELDTWLKAGQDVVNLFDPMPHRAAPHTMLLVARAAEAAHKMVRQERDQIRAEVARQLAAVDVLKQEVRELEQQRGSLRERLDVATNLDTRDAEIIALRRALRAAVATWCPRDPGGDGADGDTYRLATSALGDELEQHVDDESRCAVCGWTMPDPVKGTAGFPCRPGDCSLRPPPEKLYAPERAKREAEELHGRALRNGMPPSGRWA